MNDLLNSNNNSWTPIKHDDSCSRLLKSINSTFDNNFVKWKDYSNQVILRDSQFYYKIYEDDICHGTFMNLIREELGRIYREDYGIEWLVETREVSGKLLNFQKRQTIPPIPKQMSFVDVLEDWSETLFRLERKLELHKLNFYLIEDRPYLYNAKVKLIRDCINKFDDYGFYNGRVILLDDSDWFLAVVSDKDGEVYHPDIDYINVNLMGRDWLFGHEKLFNDSESSTYKNNNTSYCKFSLFVPNKQNLEYLSLLRSRRDVMIEDNIKILMGRKEKVSGNPLTLEKEPNPTFELTN